MESAPALVGTSAVSKIEAACRIVIEAIATVGRNIRPGVATKELDLIAEDVIRSHGAEPAFKGYVVDGLTFPSTLCISVDEEVVHGMPGEKILEEGMIVSIDCGVKKNGYYGDSAFTFPVGEVSDEKQRLMRITREALDLGVACATTRNKVYDIARAIQTHVEKNGFSVVRELVGHGIGKRLHEDPAIPNFVPPLLNRASFPNAKLQKGQALAIEPMVNAGTRNVVTLADGWTVQTSDSRPSAHFEHTVVVENDVPLVLTQM